MRPVNYSKRAQAGFSLIEVIIFIIVTGLLMSTLIVGARTALLNSGQIHNQKIAYETARMCMEWYLQQRDLKGYNTYSCPSTPAPSQCSAPTGFSVTTSITCTTWVADTNYYTIQVSVSGLASANLSLLIGSY